MTATRTGALLVDALVRHGVTDVVLAPGSRSAPLALAAAAHPDVRVHVRIDERTAGFLALGLARGTGRPAAVLCSSGTATANLHPAVLEADSAFVPLVVLTADRPPELRDTGANQTVTQVGLYGGAVRFAHEVGHDGAAYLHGIVAQAVGRARGHGGPSGPVHLNVPLREPLLETDPASLDAVVADVRAARGVAVAAGRIGRPDPEGVAEAGAAALAGMSRGMVVAGEGADSAAAEVLALAEALGMPVLAEPTSGLRAGHPALRCGAWLAATSLAEAEPPDVVVQVGRPVLSRAVAALVARAERVVVADPDGRWSDPGRTAGTIVGCRVAGLLRAVDAAGLADPDRGWAIRWHEADAAAGRVLDAALDAADGPTELGTARALAQALPATGLLVAGSSLAIRHLHEVMPPRDGLRVVGNRGASGIDGFLSTAVGAALGHDGRTAALAGDLSVVHDLPGLVIGPDEPRPALPVVVADNDGGGIFELLPYAGHVDAATYRRVFTTPHGLDLAAVAAATGQRHVRVEDLTVLPDVLEATWAEPGITLVQVRTDTPTETARRRRIAADIAAAVAEAVGS